MKQIQLIVCAAALFFCACNNDDNNKTSSEKEMAKTPVIFTETVPANVKDTGVLSNFVAYDSASAAKRPIVLIIPEWWGLNDYVKNRARQLAELGYLAIAVDMYGNGKLAANPDEAGKMATPFYKDPSMAKEHFDAALQKIKTYSQADTTKIAAIGYCFGGAMVLNMARLGEPLNGVVSFHGNLVGVPADKNLLKAKVLVCHGADDQFVKPDEVAVFKKQMDSIGADYTFKQYPGATHAFSNPAATEMGKKFNIPIAYNAAADSASWTEMKDFFGKIFK
jgi:dienelactone hydrolase